MTVIVCVDDKLGMAFGHRRQSADAQLRRRILEYCKGRPLWVNPYTAKQFEDESGNIVVDPDFLEKAGDQDYCFVETEDLLPWQNISALVLIRWNRTYPADTFLKIPGNISDWNISVIDEFPGTSHKRITMELWRKKA